MNKFTLTLGMLALASGSLLADPATGVQLESKDASGQQTGVTPITLQSRVRFAAEGVEVYEGDTRVAMFPYTSTASLSFITHGSGIKGVKDPAPFHLASNPVSDRLVIIGGPKEAGIEVFDLNGSRVLSVNNWKGEDIDVSSLNSGIYLLTLNSTTIKFIKK